MDPEMRGLVVSSYLIEVLTAVVPFPRSFQGYTNWREAEDAQSRILFLHDLFRPLQRGSGLRILGLCRAVLSLRDCIEGRSEWKEGSWLVGWVLAAAEKMVST